MNEKLWLEESLINYFIEAMNKIHGSSLKVVIHRDRPDFIIEDTQLDKKFGVEVTNLYYDTEEAKELLGREHNSISKVENIEHYIYILNRLLSKKSEKAGGYDQNHNLILLIGVTSPLFNRDDFENSRDEILIPENKFSVICLVFFNELNQNWEDLMFIKQECMVCGPNLL